MRLSSNEKILDIMERTLNYVDPRLVGHGKRTAFMVFKMLENHGAFDKKALRDISVLSMLHDIGAYETEEIDNMYLFETHNVWAHSVYGYLFLKHFSPLKEYAPAILFHHAAPADIRGISAENELIAQVISLANQADMFFQIRKTPEDFKAHIEKRRDKQLRGDVIDIFYASGISASDFAGNVDSDKSFNDVFRGIHLSSAEIEAYIRMIVYAIDFRSSQTVIHTMSVAAIAETMARLHGANIDAIEKARTGALLHDIGKVSTPVHILESTGTKLDEKEMGIMQNHVVVSEEILNGNVDDEVKWIAVNHHEKLDGAGYPRGLSADSLPLLDRLMAVADVFSALCGVRSYKGAYPKEKTVGILEGMAARDKLDAELVGLAVRCYDEIVEVSNKESARVMEDYNKVKNEHDKLLKEFQ